MSIVGPTERITDVLEGLDRGLTMHFYVLSEEEIREKSREECVADKLREKREYVVGTLGIDKESQACYIRTRGGWVRVITRKDGKHVLGE